MRMRIRKQTRMLMQMLMRIRKPTRMPMQMQMRMRKPMPMQMLMRIRIRKPKQDAGNNTFTNGNNININIIDNTAVASAIALSTLIMMEGLKENHNSENIESLVSKLTDVLNGSLKGEDSNRKAILDAINSLKKGK